MRAAIFHGAGQPITVERIAEPVPAPDELVIEVGYCGVCGSDISMTSGGPFDYPTGCFGHEYAGTVVEIGRDATGWKPGERIGVIPNTGCGRCEACAEGRVLFCQNGRSLSKGFGEYAAVPTRSAVRLPQSLSLADGALVEPMACGLRALESVGMTGGERVLVLGAGAMALSVVWWARRLGAARIVVASRSAHRAETCLAFGADAVHSFHADEPEALQAALGGAPHIVAECVGKEGMLNLAVQHVRLGGAVVCMGMCMRPEPILPVGLAFKEAKITFPLGYTPQQYEATARAFDASGFNPEQMVSDRRPLEQLDETLGAIRAGERHMKVLIDPRLEA